MTHNALSQKLGGTMFPQPMVECDGALVRLDDVLGQDFVFFCYGVEPTDLAAQLGHLPGRLKARLVGCLPRTLAFAAKSLDTMIRDQSGEIGALCDGQSAVVLLRPDRYVAAVFTPDDLASGIQIVERMIAATFDRRETLAPAV